MSALLDASINGNWKLVEEIIGNCDDLNPKDRREKRTPLILAVIDKKLEIVKLLIKNGADVNIQDKLGWSALHYAAQDYSLDIAKFLLENGALVNNQDENGNTPLFKAVFNSKERGQMIHLLLEFGANKNLENNYGVSPFQLAKTIGNYDIEKFFNN